MVAIADEPDGIRGQREWKILRVHDDVVVAKSVRAHVVRHWLTLSAHRPGVRGERLAQKRAGREARDVERCDVDARRPAVKDELGHQPSRRGAVLEAVPGEAACQEKAVDPRHGAEDRVVVGADVIEAGIRALAELGVPNWDRGRRSSTARPAPSSPDTGSNGCVSALSAS
jgi:hypothetical protein